MHSNALKPFFDGEEYPGAEVQSDDELLDAARHWEYDLSRNGDVSNGANQ